MTSVSSVYALGLRESLRGPVAEAIAATPSLREAAGLGDADVVLADLCAPDPATLETDFGTARRVLLSIPKAGEADAGTFPAQVAAREAAFASAGGDWCILRCAAFGQELAWGSRFINAGTIYAAWQPGGAPWVDVSDVVALVATLVESGDRWGAAYDVTGPEVVPVARAFGEFTALGKGPVLHVQLDEDMQRVSMTRSDYDARYAAERAGYMVWVTGERNRAVSPVLEKALGRPPRQLGDYLADAAAKLVGSR
ncbi:hypothetical protein [Amycolatopsis suaedae]|uniref:Uncharacterized protein n=1 Tax=Amycolatopsis suaedae TaxID=2510978 RepID=A0A4Q7J8S0_9PSEU|nr:hypothetical protein [Amycolatopsis suaedae]RZQ62514.1 hypothetical protein EWH70_19900 [Amycolatopsis suaedae]